MAQPQRAPLSIAAIVDRALGSVSGAGGVDSPTAGLSAATWRERSAHLSTIEDPHRLTLVFFLDDGWIRFDAATSRTRDAARVGIVPPARRAVWRCAGPMAYLQISLPAHYTIDPAAALLTEPRLADDRVLQRLGYALVDVIESRSGLDADEDAAWAIVLGRYFVRRHGSVAGLSSTPRTALTASELEMAVRFIDRHLNAPLKVADVGELFGLSRARFSALFKTSTGLAPHRFVVARRMLKAQELLATSRLSLCDVAHAVGFSSQSHMTTTFRRLTGTTPRVYRQRKPPLARDRQPPGAPATPEAS